MLSRIAPKTELPPMLYAFLHASPLKASLLLLGTFLFTALPCAGFLSPFALPAAFQIATAQAAPSVPDKKDVAPPDAEDSAPAEPPAEPQWIELRAPDQSFAISLPAAPKITATPIAGQTPLIQHDYQVDPGDGTAYHAVVFEYPEGRGPIISLDYYDRLVTAYANGSGSKVTSKSPVTIGELKGFEAVAIDRSGTLDHLIDIIPSGNRVYLLVSAGAKGHAASDEALRFRDSFHLITQATAGAKPDADAKKTDNAVAGADEAGAGPNTGKAASNGSDTETTESIEPDADAVTTMPDADSPDRQPDGGMASTAEPDAGNSDAAPEGSSSDGAAQQ